MLERLLILTLIVGAGAVGYGLWRLWLHLRLARMAQSDLPQELSDLLSNSGPAILYFTAEWCAQCRTRQTPILEQLRAAHPVQIQKLDALEHQQLANYFGVMTLPTTVLVDRKRRPVAVNHGLAPLQQLQKQLVAAAS